MMTLGYWPLFHIQFLCQSETYLVGGVFHTLNLCQIQCKMSGVEFVKILFSWSFPLSFCSVRASAVGELNQGAVNHLRSSDVAEIRLLFKLLTDQYKDL